jgi:hypothetical protein
MSWSPDFRGLAPESLAEWPVAALFCRHSRETPK